MFCACVFAVFCDAEVDWLVVALEFMRTLLLSPRTPMSDCTPVAALGFTDWIGFVCALWLAPVDWVLLCATAAVLRAAKTAAAITLRDLFRIFDLLIERELQEARCSFYAPNARCRPGETT